MILLILDSHKMQWEIADFAPVPPPGELDETYASFVILAQSLYYVKTWRHPQKWKYIALPSEKDWASASGDEYRKFREI